MLIKDFAEAIQRVIKTNPLNKISHQFLMEVERISNEHSTVSMTNLTILFEGFYRSIPNDSELKSQLALVRMQRWAHHYGTPTVTFLISYRQQIEKTCSEFKLGDVEEKSTKSWMVSETSKQIDKDNDVLVDPKALSTVSMPEKEEKTGEFVRTHNPAGGFTTTPCDPYSMQFIEYAASLKSGSKVLEVGAGFGAATLRVLFKSTKGVTVFCNDITEENLAVIRNRYLQEMKQSENTLIGDDDRLVLVPGAFPEELSKLPKASFDAILICRVLHFSRGEKIESSASLFKDLLKPGGKLFVVCETPFLKNWQKFIPEFEKRILAGMEWPGEIDNPAEFESSGRAASLPRFVHWISKEVLDRTLRKAGFFVSQSSYINRKGQFPDDLVLNGQESVGAIGENQLRAKL